MIQICLCRTDFRKKYCLCSCCRKKSKCLEKLFDMLGRRAARPRLQQPAAGQERHNAQHLGGGAQLQDRKQIREVVAQHVSRHADRVEADAGTRAGLRHGGDRRGEGDVQPGGVGVLG